MTQSDWLRSGECSPNPLRQ